MIVPGSHLGARVSALLDGQLCPSEELRVRSHLDACDACRAAVHREEWVKRRLSGLDDFAPPDGLTAVLAALPGGPGLPGPEEAEPARRPLGARLTVVAAGVGSFSAALVVLGAGYLADTPREPLRPVAPGTAPGAGWVADLPADLPTVARRAAAHRPRGPWGTMEP